MVLAFEIEFSTSLERSVNKLKRLPHSGRDALCRKGTTVDNLKHLVI
jgi:hypothetical protein